MRKRSQEWMGLMDQPRRTSNVKKASLPTFPWGAKENFGPQPGAVSREGVTAQRAMSWSWVKSPAETRAWPAGVSLFPEVSLSDCRKLLRSPALMLRPKEPMLEPGTGASVVWPSPRVSNWKISSAFPGAAKVRVWGKAEYQ